MKIDVQRNAIIGLLISGCVGMGGCGGGGGGNPPPPSAPATDLFYASVAPFLRGLPIAPLLPTVNANLTSFTISPALPSGLRLDPVSGVLTGTPTGLSSPTSYTVSAMKAQGRTTASLTLSVQTGPSVQIEVTAGSFAGDTLTYQWRSTDGVIQNINAKQTTWVAPSGPGLHFIYVMVSNGKGGYKEGRIAVSTDSIGTPVFIPTATSYTAPPRAPPTGIPLRLFVYNNVQPAVAGVIPADLNTAASGVAVSGIDTDTLESLPGFQQFLTTDGKGSVVFQNVPIGHPLGFTCFLVPFSIAGSCPSFEITASSISPSLYRSIAVPPIPSTTLLNTLVPNYPPVVGKVRLQDLSRCGVSEPFFDLDVKATVRMTYAGCTQLGICSNLPVNDWGSFTFPLLVAPGTAVTLTARCENATPLQIPIPTDETVLTFGQNVGELTLTETLPPGIGTMTATFNGSSVGTFQQDPVSDLFGRPTLEAAFLAYKGLDSRLGACRYYQAIGAVPSGACDSAGKFSSAIHFEDWKRTVQIAPYTQPGRSEVTATFVNEVDLNLTRVHHSISYGPGRMAAYVCNHPGPLSTDPASVTAAIAKAVNGQNLVACVAMDYMVSSGVNGDRPFTRFLIFGPSGELLPSVNLDGRGEKFVPGACIACHGGDKYAGKYPEDGTGSADVGAYFLPYDTGNFAYSTTLGLRLSDQEAAIRSLNMNVLDSNPTPATSALINGWYASGPTLNQNYIPASWIATNSQIAIDFYQKVIARSCRTCHAALPNSNWDDQTQFTPSRALSFASIICGGTASNPYRVTLNPNPALYLEMPNALVTFNRFWQSNQPAIYRQYANSPDTGYCQ
jgi:hypothetical protein